MFFRKAPSKEPMLLDIVPKTVKTGFVFWDINDDLGHAAEEIMSSTPLVKMSYGYARRSAAAALYLQGLFDKASYEHAVAMFKGLQRQTGQTVKFQEAAAADASEFLKSYHYLISSFFEKKAIQIANEYDIPKHRISDAELFARVVETAYVDATAALSGTNETTLTLHEVHGAAHIQKNYTLESNGFTVEDVESGDGLAVIIKDGMFHGAVLIRDIDATGPLNPWPLNDNPFQDDNHFFGSGNSHQGPWSFSIRPSVPFSQLLREARDRYQREET